MRDIMVANGHILVLTPSGQHEVDRATFSVDVIKNIARDEGIKNFSLISGDKVLSRSNVVQLVRQGKIDYVEILPYSKLA